MNPSDTLLEPMSFVGYTCPHCPAWSTDADVARLHCICPVEGCNKSRRSAPGYRTHCPVHLDERAAAREADHLAAMRPVNLADVSECPMFYCANTDRYDPDIDDLIEDCRGIGIADADIVVHPCTEGTVHTPDILDYIDEAWGGEFTDDSYDGPPISASTRMFVDTAQNALQQDAPTIYRPADTHRITLPEANR